jgi:uncharacterized membrane protein YraQ (UPF0718 family)
LNAWSEASLTTLGYFWKAFWAFVLGYVISGMIQVFVTRERMRRSMGEAGPRSVGLATFFGFISSSCSFAALATTRSLFQKGAGLVPSLAFLLASTNLVIELGIVIAIFLGWQFVVGEYLGGVLLILMVWLIVRLSQLNRLVESVRDRIGGDEDSEEVEDWRQLIRSREGWERVGRKYLMEWGMVWKDVTFGFTVAGIIAAMVPRTFFETIFIGAGSEGDPAFWEILAQTLVGPLAAFFTFIGSMGNIPLASVLFANGVSFAGIMAFIFSDLVVFPVLRMNAKFYGWKMALYILGVFLLALVASALLLHYGFALLGVLPEGAQGSSSGKQPERFAVDYTFWMNLIALGASGLLAWLVFSPARQQGKDEGSEGGEHEDNSRDQSGGGGMIAERLLKWLAVGSIVWLTGGLIASFFRS